MASRFILPFSDVGKGITPSDGALLEFFTTGTSTQKDTFSDEALLIKNANPVVADANGVFPDIWTPDGARYKVTLDDKNIVQKFESDPVVSAQSATLSAKTFDTVADMVASIETVLGDIIDTAGRITKGDGGDNHYEAVASGTGTDDGGSFIDSTGVPTIQFKGLFPGGKINNKQFGAVVDGSTDDAIANQAAIDFVGLTEATLEMSEGVTMVGTGLQIQKPISLLGTGRQSKTTGANPTDGSCTIKALGVIGDVIKIRSATTAEFMYGVTIRDIVIDGNNVAGSGITGQTVADCTFENILALRCTTQGLLLDDDNGNISLHNRILGYQYNATANAASIGSHGIFLKDTLNGGVQKGVVQTYMENIQTFTEDGNGVFMRGCDNNVLTKFQGFIVSGGTGKSLFLGNGLTVDARNNLVTYMAGTVKAENKTRGNRITHLISEGASVSIDVGGQLHYEVVDNVNAELFETHFFTMSDQLTISSTAMTPDGTLAIFDVHAAQWGVIAFPPTTDGIARGNLVVPFNWNDGNIIGVELLFAMDAANTTDDVRIKVRLNSIADAGATATPDVNQDFTVTVNDTANRVDKKTLTFSSAVSYVFGNLVVFSIQRLGSDGLDTAAGNMDLFGINIIYEGTGANSVGSGPFDIPPTGV